MSSIEHKYTFFVGTARVVTEQNLRTPVPITCSYFRQLEVLADPTKAIKGYTPYTDITLRRYCRPDKGVPQCPAGYTGAGNICHNVDDPSKSAKVICSDGSEPTTMPLQLGFNIALENISSIPKPFDLRYNLERALVKSWDHKLHYRDQIEGIYQSYYEMCKPQNCFYDVPQEREFATIATIFLGIVGGLAAIVRAGVSGIVDAFTSVCFGMRRLDIVELHDKNAQKAVELAERKRKIAKAKQRAVAKAEATAKSSDVPVNVAQHASLVAALVPPTLSVRPAAVREV